MVKVHHPTLNGLSVSGQNDLAATNCEAIGVCFQLLCGDDSSSLWLKYVTPRVWVMCPPTGYEITPKIRWYKHFLTKN